MKVRRNWNEAIDIGALITFIAMVFVAGIVISNVITSLKKKHGVSFGFEHILHL